MYLESPSIDTILAAIAHLNPQKNDVVLLLIGESATLNIDRLIQRLASTDLTFIGAIFPAIISAKSHSNSGIILKVLPAATSPYLIRDLDQQITLPDFETELALSEHTRLTALVWIDGLTSQINNFLAELYNNLGNSVRYLGGGAGSLSLKQQPCIFTREGCFQNAALIFFVALESQLGVQHGWQRLQGPFPATQTHHNTIAELNWQNAFSVYKSVVEADSQKSINAENFFEIAKGYPFGIFQAGQEDIVRDPIVVNGQGELICVGEVPENALLYILRGDTESLVAATRQAAAAANQGDSNRLQDYLVVDCISRVLFLGDEFAQELAALRENLIQPDSLVALEGVLTLGEISSHGEGFLEFFNKTIVVGALYRQS